MDDPGEDLRRLAETCVVLLGADLDREPRAGGSGVWIAPELILTCAHVVPGGPGIPVQVQWRGHRLVGTVTDRLPADVGEAQAGLWPFPDLAVVEVTDADRALDGGQPHPCAWLANTTPVDGRPVMMFGHTTTFNETAGLVPASMIGTLSGWHNFGDGRYLQVKGNEIKDGMSGGPVLDLTAGVVCALVTTTIGLRADRGGYLLPLDGLSFLPVGRRGQVLDAARRFHDSDDRWARLRAALARPAATGWSRPRHVGEPPALAAAFQPRKGLRDRMMAARRAGTNVVLTQDASADGPAGAGVLTGGGGVGKSQLAAWFAAQASTSGTVDLLVWVNAASEDQIITGFAQAAAAAGAPGADGTDPGRDAQLLLAWLADTDRRWLIVLDDITDPADVAGWWPPRTATGWTLCTTRRRDAALTGAGRTRIGVDVYTPPESSAYLRERLTAAGESDLFDTAADALCAELGQLPLALSHAAAYMIDQGESCADYLRRYTSGRERLDELMPAGAPGDGYPRAVAVTLLLALDAADTQPPTGLARPAIALAAVLDPAGHPDELWATPAVTDHLTRQRSTPDRTPVTTGQAHQALRLLHRYGLLTHTNPRGPRTVRIHALTARAAREAIPATDLPAIAHAAADALSQLWPNNDRTTTDVIDALRTNVTTLHAVTGDTLWRPDVHPVLYRTGNSLLRAGLHTPAITHWQTMVADAGRLLGEEHPSTLTARVNLASSYQHAGRIGDAITILERVVADSERLRGDQHPETLTARANLAGSYQEAGRTGEAITILERVVADSERLRGEEHPETMAARANLAVSYEEAGRIGEAITILERIVADSERLLGEEHPSTLTVRANLAVFYQEAGRTGEAITILERVVADSERLRGEEHPETMAARANLAVSYREAGQTGEAITILERIVADSERLLGEEHPSTLTAQVQLASSYQESGRIGEAITILERVVADSKRLRGEEHPETLTAQVHLAGSYRKAGQTGEAITILERIVADSERLLGEEHPSTLIAQINLAGSCREAGRISEAITILERVVADSKRLRGEEHPDTMAARANLASSYREAGRIGEAITILERVVADAERLLGEEHPNTRAAVNALRAWRAAG